MVVSAAGAIENESDYYPWGGELKISATDTGNHYKFTGKERDSETGLDCMLARYYSNPLSRFLTPDWAAKPITVPYANFGNPQSLNLYTYGKNNPTTFGDPDGHCVFDVGCWIKLAVWTGAGVAADGGVKPFAKNLGIGALKGAGSFAVNTAKTAVAVAQANSGNHVGAAVTLASPGPKVLQPSNETQAGASKVTQVGLAVATTVAPMLSGGGAASTLSDSALVVRGGLTTADRLASGSGVTVDASGNLSGLSVQSANGASVGDLAGALPNKQIGVTTVGDVRAAGGEVVPDPLPGNPNHCEMCGVTPQKASELFQPQKNPNPLKKTPD
jgi:RHS repeat-associated protein